MGAIGLLIAQGLGLMRGYWVLITVCVLLLRSHILVTFSFTAMLIIGTIGGAVIGSIIIANVHSIWSLVSLFVFTSIFYAVKNVNYALASSLPNSIYPCISEYSNPWSNIACANENIRYHNWCRPLVTRSIYYLGVLLSEEISIHVKASSLSEVVIIV